MYTERRFFFGYRVQSLQKLDNRFLLLQPVITNCDGQHPMFLGLSLIHFQKNAFIISRFASEMCSFQLNIRNLNAIGTDEEMAIYRGFAVQRPDFMCLSSPKKWCTENTRACSSKGSTQNIICDIYGRNYEGVRELRLLDSIDIADFKLESLKSDCDNLCPGFRKSFSKKQPSFFEQSVIESARTST